MGPTASGKTDLAIEIAGVLDCELISVDSALVYRGLDIGSAKPSYPHHLVDICDPAVPYSAANFVEDAERVVGEVISRGKTPLLVGGTMLYFKAFLEGMAQMPASDPEVRQQIETQARERGWPALHDELASIDPESAARIHPNHSQRLSRALEVYRVSGTPISQWQKDTHRSGAFERFDVRQLALNPLDRGVLHARISRRFEQMLAAGFLAEVEGLRRRADLHSALPAVRAVGYRQLWQHLEGDYSLAEAGDRVAAATRQLAKRQLTWLRKWPNLNWINTDEKGNLLAWSESEQKWAQSAESPLNAALNYLDRPSV
ncbi:MAG: tRNA (adenosine(37)-N6)-dimethylallyltransferase MiaA [Halioglobus sp.]